MRCHWSVLLLNLALGSDLRPARVRHNSPKAGEYQPTPSLRDTGTGRTGGARFCELTSAGTRRVLVILPVGGTNVKDRK
jgi:hypothetical protein